MSKTKFLPHGFANGRFRLMPILWLWLISLFAPHTLFGAQFNFTTYSNGIGNAALFGDAFDVAVDSAGNILVADYGNHTIRKITPAGGVSTIAGSPGTFGTTDGTGSAARFNAIWRIATDDAGNAYALVTTGVGGSYVVAIRKITSSGVVTTIFQSEVAWGVSGNSPWWDFLSFAVDTGGNLYLHDSNENRICKILPDGTVTTLCSGEPGNHQVARGMTVDQFGNVYVASWGSAPSKLCKISPAGTITPMITPSPTGLYNGPDGAFQIGTLDALTVDNAGNVYASDAMYAGIYKISPTFEVSLLAGGNGNGLAGDGSGRRAYFFNTRGITLDGMENIVVADVSSVRKVSPTGDVTTIAGCPPLQGNVDGQGSSYGFNTPLAVAVDGAGYVYVTDFANHAIRKVLPNGSVTIFAGKIAEYGSTDGPATVARFQNPKGIAVDGSGNVFVTEYTKLRKISPDGQVVTFAGATGQLGTQDGPGTQARFYDLRDIAIDSANNIYATDGNNYTVRKITPAGTVTTVAGLGGERGTEDGTGSTARFWNLRGIAIDGMNNLLVIDYGKIRKITPSGVVTTITGRLGEGSWKDGPATEALFSSPVGLAVDASGNIFVSENDGRIRMLSPDGMVSTIGGPTYTTEFGKSDGIGEAARFTFPAGITFDANGNLFIADSGNNSIRKGLLATDVAPYNAIITISVE